MKARRARVVAVAAALASAVVVGLQTGADGADPVRYLDRVFEEVDVTSDIVYGEGEFDGATVQLKLDLYEPHGDPATARPLVVWAHGAGPASDDKADPIDVDVAKRFARHGAVVASINYRWKDFEPPSDIVRDPRIAVAWLRANASTYRIDTERIAFAGISAGAYRTMHAAYDGDVTAGEPPVDQQVDAVLSFSGTGPTDTFQPGEPPLFMAHGELDVNAPYANAQATCEGAVAGGVPCEFHHFADADHYGLFAHADELEVLASRWLYETLDLANAQDPPLPPPDTTTTSPPATSTTTTTVPVATTSTPPSTDPDEPPPATPATPVDETSDYAG